MRKAASLILILGFVFYVLTLTAGLFSGSAQSDPGHVGAAILSDSPERAGAANTVTSVVVLYRGFDTLGEVTVLFLSALGIGLLLHGLVRGGGKDGGGQDRGGGKESGKDAAAGKESGKDAAAGKDADREADREADRDAGKDADREAGKDADREAAAAGEAREESGFILATGAKILFPLFFLFGLYIIAHGHLSPGGGFPGGVIVATGFFTALLTGAVVKEQKWLMSLLEGLAGLSFIGLGVAGLFGAPASFLAQTLPTGEFGTLFSAGLVPLLYAVVGVKVASELSSAVGTLYFAVPPASSGRDAAAEEETR